MVEIPPGTRILAFAVVAFVIIIVLNHYSVTWRRRSITGNNSTSRRAQIIRETEQAVHNNEIAGGSSEYILDCIKQMDNINKKMDDLHEFSKLAKGAAETERRLHRKLSSGSIRSERKKTRILQDELIDWVESTLYSSNKNTIPLGIVKKRSSIESELESLEHAQLALELAQRISETERALEDDKYAIAGEKVEDAFRIVEQIREGDNNYDFSTKVSTVLKYISELAEDFGKRHQTIGEEKFNNGEYDEAYHDFIKSKDYFDRVAYMTENFDNINKDVESMADEVERYISLSGLVADDLSARTQASLEVASIAETDPALVVDVVAVLVDQLEEPSTLGPAMYAIANVAEHAPGELASYISEVGSVIQKDGSGDAELMSESVDPPGSADELEDVRLYACRTLREVGSSDPSLSPLAVEYLIKGLDKEPTRAAAVGALLEIAGVAPEAFEGHISEVGRVIDTGDKDTRLEACQTLKRIATATPSLAPEVADQLVRGLNSSTTRAATIRALVEIANVAPEALEDHIPAISATVGVADEEVQLAACRILKRIGTEDAVQRLRETRTEVNEYELKSEIESMIQEVRQESQQETVYIDEMQTSIPQPNTGVLGSDAGVAEGSELPEHETLELIGSGGNADVKKIQLNDSGKIVALKIPRWQGTISASVVEEFQSEAATWARIDDSTHIVDVLGSGTSPYPWILLEYMPDGSLRSKIDQDGLSLPATRNVLLNICRGVRHAHRHGIVHADLKPENVLFRDDVAKVGDWGLARVLLEHSTSIEGMTPNYAAPEQLDPDQYGSVDDQTDVYQIGVIAYETLTGSVPFESSTPAGTVTSILTNEPVPPSERNSQLSDTVDDVLLTAMAKEKADRYESVLYLRDAIKQMDL